MCKSWFLQYEQGEFVRLDAAREIQNRRESGVSVCLGIALKKTALKDVSQLWVTFVKATW